MRIKIIFPAMLLVLISCAAAGPGNIPPEVQFHSVKDTIDYLQKEIIYKKTNYVNGRLSVLLKQLLLQPRSFILITNFIKTNESRYIEISFTTTNEGERRLYANIKNPYLAVYWSSPIPMDSVVSLLRKNKGEWTSEEDEYFGKQLIGDVKLY